MQINSLIEDKLLLTILVGSAGKKKWQSPSTVTHTYRASTDTKNVEASSSHYMESEFILLFI